MSSFTFFLVCLQACLIQNVFSQCLGSPIGYGAGIAAPCYGAAVAAPGLAAPYSLGAGLAGSYGYGAGYGAGYPCGYGAAYGGAGIGNVGVAGELPVGGATAVAGQVPIIGAVGYNGCVPAAGGVTISGNCAYGCGCGGAYY